MAFSIGMPWNKGEELMHKLLRVPEYDNPTSSMLTPQASFMLQKAPLLAIGTLDSQDRPWTTLWGGQPGFSQPLGGGIIGTRTIVDGINDPVVQALISGVEKGEMIQGSNNLVSGLTIDLMTRKRVKTCGRMVAAALGEVDVEFEAEADKAGAPEKQDQLQLVTKIEQSLGNCPKYLNQYELRPVLVTSKLISQSPSLSTEAKALISRSDMFFMTSSTEEDMDTNHRGGPPGFVRIVSDTEFVYPEYSGNQLYQTLGNLQMNPKVGITFPEYSSGDVLYITGEVEILILDQAARILPGSNLAVKVRIDEARLVEGGLPFRGTKKKPSPYNPLVRTLSSEGNIKSAFSGPNKIAQLTKKIKITPTISRFRFTVPGGISYESGQWVALDFSRDLDYGYSHMREDDPRSLNDDFVRTFTISSTPSDDGIQDEFDITVRAVGPATDLLFRQNERAGFEVPLLGIGGEFKIQQEEGKVTPFVAGGVGITPLLGQMKDLTLSPFFFRLLWTLRLENIDLVVNTMQQYRKLGACTEVFFTGLHLQQPIGAEEKIVALQSLGVKVQKRRILKHDLLTFEADTWYLCTGKALREDLLTWLEGKKAVYEDFNY